MIIVNFGLVPLMVDIAVQNEDYERKSSMVNAVIVRIFFFMFMNTLLIPISETTSAQVLIKIMRETEITSWPTLVSNNLMNH
jgi:hypothetical protein